MLYIEATATVADYRRESHHLFTNFIEGNKHISNIHFNECFDSLACARGIKNLATVFNKNNPIRSRIHVGNFVTLETECLSNPLAESKIPLPLVTQLSVKDL